MYSILNDIYESLKNTSLTEIIAVIFGVFYLLLIMFKIRVGWLFAAFSTGIYIVLSYKNSLYIESVLQIFYFIMAFVGFFMWNKGETEELMIYKWSLLNHLKAIAVGVVLCVILGLVFKYFSDQSDPFLDAFTTVFSLIATFLTVKRVLSNWIYWIVIDAALVVLYYSNNLVLTSYHYGVYIVLAVIGYLKWFSYYKTQKQNV